MPKRKKPSAVVSSALVRVRFRARVRVRARARVRVRVRACWLAAAGGARPLKLVRL